MKKLVLFLMLVLLGRGNCLMAIGPEGGGEFVESEPAKVDPAPDVLDKKARDEAIAKRRDAALLLREEVETAEIEAAQAEKRKFDRMSLPEQNSYLSGKVVEKEAAERDGTAETVPTATPESLVFESAALRVDKEYSKSLLERAWDKLSSLWKTEKTEVTLEEQLTSQSRELKKYKDRALELERTKDNPDELKRLRGEPDSKTNRTRISVLNEIGERRTEGETAELKTLKGEIRYAQDDVVSLQAAVEGEVRAETDRLVKESPSFWDSVKKLRPFEGRSLRQQTLDFTDGLEKAKGSIVVDAANKALGGDPFSPEDYDMMKQLGFKFDYDFDRVSGSIPHPTEVESALSDVLESPDVKGYPEKEEQARRVASSLSRLHSVDKTFENNLQVEELDRFKEDKLELDRRFIEATSASKALQDARLGALAEADAAVAAPAREETWDETTARVAKEKFGKAKEVVKKKINTGASSLAGTFGL